LIGIEPELLAMKITKKQIRSVIKQALSESAYIDQNPDDVSLPGPDVRASWIARSERLKRKRQRPPANWQRILTILKNGGYMTDEPHAGRTHILYVDDEGSQFFRVQAKTVDELCDAGLVKHDGHSYLVIND